MIHSCHAYPLRNRYRRWFYCGLLCALRYDHVVAQTPTLVSHVAGQTTTSAIDTRGANLFLVCLSSYNVSGVADSLGNNYTQITSAQAGGDLGLVMYASFNPTTSASMTFTSGGGTVGLAAAAYAGLASGVPDKTSAITSLSQAAALSPTNPNELIAGCAGMGGTPSAFSVASPLTRLDSSTTQQWGVADAYQIQTTATSVNPTWTVTGGYSPASLVAFFYSQASPASLITTTTSLAEGFVGSAYSQQLASSGGVAPYTWTLASGTLPAGLSLSSAGLISGTPITAISATPLTFRVTDTRSTTANTASLPLTVAATALNISTLSLPSGTQYVAYSTAIAGSGGTAPLSYAFSTAQGNVSLPEGLTINSSTGAISGTIQGQGIYNTTFTLTDGLGTVFSKPLTIVVTPDNSWVAALFPADSIYHGGLPIQTVPLYTGLGAPPLRGHLTVVFGPTVNGDGGMPIQRVPANTPNVAVGCVNPTDPSNCYQNPLSTAPVSAFTPVENSPNNSSAYGYITDGHALVYRPGGGVTANGMLYEFYNWQWGGTQGYDVSNSGFDTTGYALIDASLGGDAAGLCITCYLANYDSMFSGAGYQNNMIRFTLPSNQILASHHWWPATSQSVNGGFCTGGYQDGNGLMKQSNPPTNCATGRTVYGTIYRLKASAYGSLPSACTGTNTQAKAFMATLYNRGMILSDIGGDNIGIVGTADPRWDSGQVQSCFTAITGDMFEPVDMSSMIINAASTRYFTLPTLPCILICGGVILQNVPHN